MNRPQYRFECGDCLQLLETVPAQSVHMVLCDLPYGTTQNTWDVKLDVTALFAAWERVCVPGAAIVLTGTHPFTAQLVTAYPSGFEFAWIWKKSTKTGHLNAHRRPMREHEDVLVFRAAKWRVSGSNRVYNPQGLQPCGQTNRRTKNGTNFGKSGLENFQEWTNYPSSIIHFANDPKPVHPTQKPLALCEYFIRTYSNPGDTVLDCCAGSGTTAVAAWRTGRGFIAFEKDPNYWALASNRVCAEMQGTAPHE